MNTTICPGSDAVAILDEDLWRCQNCNRVIDVRVENGIRARYHVLREETE